MDPILVNSVVGSEKLQPSNDLNYISPFSLRLKRAALKIVEIWRSLTSSIQGLLTRESSRIKKGELLKGSDILNEVQKLNDNVALLPSTIISQGQEIKDEYLNKIAATDKPIAFLPLTIRGKLRNHIVFFAVNKNSKEIIFYDSKGWSLADYGLKESYHKIEKKYPGYTLAQNVNKEQYDTFNCGMYVIDRIKKISNDPNAKFEDLLKQNPLSYDDVMKARRESVSQHQKKVVDKQDSRVGAEPSDDEGVDYCLI